MRIEETFVLDAPRDTAFALLRTVDRVAACVPGVENLEPSDDGTYTASLRTAVGPISAVFAGTVEVTPEPPDRLRARGRGRDRTSGSRAEVTFDAQLTPLDDGRTQVDSVADVTIRGRLGQFGTGVIRATATEIIREFVACANDHLTTEEGAPAPATPPRASGRLLWRVVVSVVRGWWRRLTRRGRGSQAEGRG